MNRAIARGGAPFIVLGQKDHHGDAASAVGSHVRVQFAFSKALNEANVNFLGVGLPDPLNQWALLNAIAAPDAAKDQNLHVADKSGHELLLDLGQVRRVVHLFPAALLLFVSRLQVAIVRKARHEFVRQIGGVWHTGRIIH
jgi:hypothetical protein